jgi:hypothetical protein
MASNFPKNWSPSRSDTRRRNGAGKMVGGHSPRESARIYKRALHRAERRLVKALLGGACHPRAVDGFVSEMNYRGT